MTDSTARSDSDRQRHTLGPWWHQPVFNGHGELVHDFIADEQGNVIADVSDPKDAPVIAAAPELLAALILVTKRCGPNSSDGAIARAAIAKATGAA